MQLCLLFLCGLLILQPYQAEEYSFSENIAEALQQGEFLWKSREIESALIEFENVLLMEPSNVKGMTGVFNCYLRLERLDDARDMLDKIRGTSMSETLVERLQDALDEAERLEDQKAARDFFALQRDDFLSATEAPPPPKGPEVKEVVLKTDTARGKFAKALQLHRKGYTVQAIPLFMDAIMEDGNLIYANDYKLMEASRDYYSRQVELEPKNLKNLFILGWIWEHYMNQDEAEKIYKQVLTHAGQQSPEAQVANGKLQQIAQERERLAVVRAQEEEELRRDSERFRKLQISNGKFSGYSDGEYLELGKQYLEEKNLEEAIIHLQGAIRVLPEDPHSHYYYALAQMESAWKGNDNGFFIAKRELEQTLELNPPADLRQKSQQLLDSLTTQDEDQPSSP